MLQPNQKSGIDLCHCFTTRQASRRITRFYDAHLEPAGLKITQFLTLAALFEMETATVNALAERLDVERTAMGKMIGFLEKDGHVKIKASPTDGRSRIVELTKSGQRLFEKGLPLWEKAQQEFEQLNGKEAADNLKEGLKKMVVGKLTEADSDE